jgi:hypothetical protein
MDFTKGHIYEYYSDSLEQHGAIIMISEAEYLQIESNRGFGAAKSTGHISNVDCDLWEWVDHGFVSKNLAEEINKHSKISMLI